MPIKRRERPRVGRPDAVLTAALALLAPILGVLLPAEAARSGSDPSGIQRAVVRSYAEFAHAVYAESETHARRLRTRIRELVQEPTPASLEAAREAWRVGRRVYERSEVLRFYGGPIDGPYDGVETFLNAWPLDEAYIDAVEGSPDAGIINDPVRHPNLDGSVLTFLNERGGEANVSIGWHAIEFLLWGQDLYADGPGRRSHEDFVAGTGRNAERRAEYLLRIADLLVLHLTGVKDAWAPDASNYRAVFEREAHQAIRNIITGMTVLSGFEMSGERMAVAYETRDQEEEHSCFSDNSHVDLIANQEGIVAVYRGSGPGTSGPGLRELARTVDADLAAEIDARLTASVDALGAIPAPFDRAIQGADTAPGRRAVLAAMEALEAQAESLATLGLLLGSDIPLVPGG